MPKPKVDQRAALMRWLTQIHYNQVRNVETIYPSIIRTDERRPLRGLMVASDLCLTRKRVFFRVDNVNCTAIPVSIDQVASEYSVSKMQTIYRKEMDKWKSTHLRRRIAS